jgi:uncharacterized protein YjiS (DUF1127 family)
MDTNGNCHYFATAHIHPRSPWFHRLSPARLIDLLSLWCERAAQRRRLAQLDDRMLRDIGVSRSEAWCESRKWFWQD